MKYHEETSMRRNRNIPTYYSQEESGWLLVVQLIYLFLYSFTIYTGYQNVWFLYPTLVIIGLSTFFTAVTLVTGIVLGFRKTRTIFQNIAHGFFVRLTGTVLFGMGLWIIYDLGYHIWFYSYASSWAIFHISQACASK